MRFSYFEALGAMVSDCLMAEQAPKGVQIGEGLDGRVITKGLSEFSVGSAEELTELVEVTTPAICPCDRDFWRKFGEIAACDCRSQRAAGRQLPQRRMMHPRGRTASVSLTVSSNLPLRQ